ncbi:MULTISPECIES: Fur family transcriptional regulator [Arthrobacter]|uniref:Transcriptional repressor n=1 Tax=Arthrobacter terricola TaxID=2547396 RepID=A0A4R5L261_9MICC|nr:MULTISPECIES: Fur family transcriptional regulator [Arthrobacter]MBT8159135.1 transcriptional repressor [Arthrobacter sp. GN70]TDG01793.1 transcriptional repressor [Arthrobacter terricola]
MADHTVDQEAWASALHSHGRRVTKQRLAVLAAVQNHPHSPAEAILAAARKDLPELTAQSVYVVLSDLTDLQMLRRFEPPHSPALYETRVGDNHHHAVCISCGRVEDVDCAVGHAPCLTPHWDEHSKPMTIQIADVLYQGICQDCQAKQQLPTQTYATHEIGER